MSLTRWSIRNPVALWFGVSVAAIAGAVSFQAMPRAEFPDFTIRTALVVTPFPGASPEEVNRLVTEPLEEAVRALGGVDYVESESRRNLSIIRIHLEPTVSDVRGTWDEMRRRIGEVTPRLPSGVAAPIINDRFGDVYGIQVAVTGKGASLEDLNEVAVELRRRIARLVDASDVQLHGAPVEHLEIVYDDEEMASLGATPLMVAQSVRQWLSGAPNVSVERGVNRIHVAVQVSADRIDDLRLLPLPSAPGQLVRLQDVATVRFSVDDTHQRWMTFNGEPAVGVSVSMRSGARITEFGPEVISVVESFQRELPGNVTFHTVTYEPETVRRAIRDFIRSLAQAIVMVVVVMVLFLGLRVGVVTAAVIPLTVLATLLGMSWLGLGLNRITIAGLIIALGLLVDCAIVIAEGIRAEVRRGQSARDAAEAVGSELGLPLLGSMLATAAALLPILLADHPVSEITGPLALVVAIAIVLSWVLSLTVIPNLATRFFNLQAASEPSAGGSPVPSASTSAEVGSRLYRGFASWVLSNRGLTMGAAMGLFAVSIGLFHTGVPQDFFPPSDEPMFTVELLMPPGASSERTRVVASALEEHMGSMLAPQPKVDPRAPSVLGHFGERSRRGAEGIASWATYVGSGAPRFNLSYQPALPHPGYAIVKVNTTHAEKGAVMAEIRRWALDHVPEATVRVLPIRRGPWIEYPVEVRIAGADILAIHRLAVEVEGRMVDTPGLVNVSRDWGHYVPLVRWNVNADQAALSGVPLQGAGQAVATQLVSVPLGRFRGVGELTPVVLRSTRATEPSLAALSSLGVHLPGGGGFVPLDQIASRGIEFEPESVRSFDTMPTVTVRADISPEAPRKVTPISVAGELDRWLTTNVAGFPEGLMYQIGGELEVSREARAALRQKAPVALSVILLILVGLFNSVRKTAVVILGLPLAFAGVTVGLFITQEPFSFMAILGVIGLMGIMINQGVVLIKRIEREAGKGDEATAEAIVRAVCRRASPIIMATLTTMAGLIALWINGEPMFVPLAVAMLSGLVVALPVTLGVLPVMYALIHGVRRSGQE